MSDSVSDDDVVHAPVTLDVHGDSSVSLRFGPMPFDDLLAILAALGTGEGQLSFTEQLEKALVAEREARRHE